MNAWETVQKESFDNVTGYGQAADIMIKNGVVAGIKFLEEHSDVKPLRTIKTETGIAIYPPTFEENGDFKILRDVVSPKLYGGSGSMYEQAVSIVYFWVMNGTDELIRRLRQAE